MPERQWQHEVREGLRNVLWQQAVQKRVDFDGLQFGVDRTSTLALLQGKRLDDHQKGILRGVLTGAVWFGHALFGAGLLAEDVCQYCGESCSEDLDHLWWRCPAWNHVRCKHYLPWWEFKDFWPPCFK
eukprot:11773266-Karenia_brevis.AAC.1